MEILERLPEDVIGYITEFIPNNHIIPKYSLSTMYLNHKSRTFFYIGTSIKSYIKYRKLYIIYIVKVNKFGPSVGMTCVADLEKINKIKLPVCSVDLVTTSWYVNKKYKNIVDSMFPKASLKQKILNGFFQMLLIGYIRSYLNDNYDVYRFYQKYILFFLIVNSCRLFYEHIIVA